MLVEPLFVAVGASEKGVDCGLELAFAGVHCGGC